MPDINLLEESKEPGERNDAKPKFVPPAPVQYSRPEAKGPGEHPLKKPSSFGLWMRSLFRGKPQGKALPPLPLQKQQVKETREADVKNTGEPEDIFAGIASVSGGPQEKTVSLSPREAAPAGPKPGEFPPLPTPPAWTKPTVPATTPRPQPVPPTPLRQQFGTTPDPQSPMLHPVKMRVQGAKRDRTKRDEDEEEGGVNLLPEELVTTFDLKKQLTTLSLIVVASALVVGIVYVSLLLWEQTQVRKTDEKRVQTQEVLVKLKSLRKEQEGAILLKSSNDVLRQLLNKHIYWTKFFKLFEQYTLPDIFYPSGASVDLSGHLTLTGVAPDIETMIAQLNVYRNAKDFIVSAETRNITRRTGKGEKGYNFIVEFQFVPDIFYQPIDVAQSSTTGGGTAATNVNTNANAITTTP